MVITSKSYLSVLIQKVAEVFVLRRQFPLGGLFTAEEMGIDNIGNDTEGATESSEQNLPGRNSGQPEFSPENEEKKNKETSPSQEQQEKPQKPEVQAKESKTSSVSSGQGGKEYTLVEMEVGKSPSGVEFAKIFVKELSAPILAKGEEGLQEVAKVEGGAGDKVILETYQENGFTFLKKVASASAAA